MAQASFFAESFAEGLTQKFANEGDFASKIFTVNPGRRFDKIVQSLPSGDSRSVHAFVERATGNVYKAAGWNAPAQGIRYFTIDSALEAATLHGGYLYR